MASNELVQARKPNWVVLKEAAQQLVKSGKTVFTRKELTRMARQIDDTRSEASLDFEVDLVTVNSNSKDKYRDLDKLFLYRLERGRYTLYNPELHGSIEEFLYAKTFHIKKEFLAQIVNELEARGYKVVETAQAAKPWSPNVVAIVDNSSVGVWIVDPSQYPTTQMKTVAYAIGSSMLNRSFEKHIIVLPQLILSRIPADVREQVEKFNIKFVTLREERKYSIAL